MAIRRAEKHQAKLRLCLIGPAGSGKTYSALAIGTNLGGKVGVIDTERGSADLYADKFQFDVDADMVDFAPGHYVEKILEFGRLGYDVLIIDSLTHAWSGIGGALEMVDKAGARSQGNKYVGWRTVTPEHNKLVETILAFPGHVITTLRSKMDYVQEKDDRGKTVIRKVGMAPIQREGMEYEFTIVGDMDTDHALTVTKSRCSAVADATIKHPGKQFADTLLKWLNEGTAPTVNPATVQSEEQEAIDADFVDAVNEAFDRRGIPPETARGLIAAVAKKAKVDRITMLPPEERTRVISNINSGAFDKFIKPAEPVTA